MEIDNNQLRAIIEADPLTTTCSVQFSSVAQSCPTLCDPMNRSMPGLPVSCCQITQLDRFVAVQHLKQIGKVKKLNKLVPHEWTTNQKEKKQSLF